MYRLELVEKDVNFGNYKEDMKRLSAPIKDITKLGEMIIHYMVDFEKELKSKKYYFQIKWYDIEER